VDLALEKLNGDYVRQLIRNRRVHAAHDCSDGGFLIAATEMALAGNIGLDIRRPSGNTALSGWYFGEDQARYLLAVDQNSVNPILSTADGKGVKAAMIGTFGGSRITSNDGLDLEVSEIRSIYEAWFPTLMES